MNSSRKNALITGILFIIATVAALAAAPFESNLNGGDYLGKLAANANSMTFGIFFYLIAAFSSVGIAISLYTVLKERNAGLALGAIIFRTIEAVMYIVAVVSLLALVTLSQHLQNSDGAMLASFQVTGDILRSVREHATLAGVFAFSLGALLYYYLFFQTRLIPRWLAGWGIVASGLMLLACLLALFNYNYVTSYALLIFPIAVQEMVLAIWLLIKGFDSSAIALSYPKYSKMETTELLKN